MDIVVFYYIVIVLFILSISIQQVRKYKRENKIITKSLKANNAYIILGLVWLVIAYLNIKMFIKYYEDTYSVLKPEYIKNWYELLNYNYAKELKQILQVSDSDVKYRSIDRYVSHGYDKLLVAITQILFAIGYSLRGREWKNDIIYEDGIYGKNGNYKWDRIREYSWSGLRTDNKNREYYDLEFKLRDSNGRVSRYFSWEGKKSISMSINEKDRERTDRFLRETINNENI